ncbi:MAG TPA: hypothetical protein G4O18_08355 [Dehalococcoidia bacterium]|nr:hypothetical protein [Dehalococcoidia bacterium]
MSYRFLVVPPLSTNRPNGNLIGRCPLYAVDSYDRHMPASLSTRGDW